MFDKFLEVLPTAEGGWQVFFRRRWGCLWWILAAFVVFGLFNLESCGKAIHRGKHFLKEVKCSNAPKGCYNACMYDFHCRR